MSSSSARAYTLPRRGMKVSCPERSVACPWLSADPVALPVAQLLAAIAAFTLGELSHLSLPLDIYGTPSYISTRHAEFLGTITSTYQKSNESAITQLGSLIVIPSSPNSGSFDRTSSTAGSNIRKRPAEDEDLSPTSPGKKEKRKESKAKKNMRLLRAIRAVEGSIGEMGDGEEGSEGGETGAIRGSREVAGVSY